MLSAVTPAAKGTGDFITLLDQGLPSNFWIKQSAVDFDRAGNAIRGR